MLLAEKGGCLPDRFLGALHLVGGSVGAGDRDGRVYGVLPMTALIGAHLTPE